GGAGLQGDTAATARSEGAPAENRDRTHAWTMGKGPGATNNARRAEEGEGEEEAAAEEENTRSASGTHQLPALPPRLRTSLLTSPAWEVPPAWRDQSSPSSHTTTSPWWCAGSAGPSESCRRDETLSGGARRRERRRARRRAAAPTSTAPSGPP